MSNSYESILDVNEINEFEQKLDNLNTLNQQLFKFPSLNLEIKEKLVEKLLYWLNKSIDYLRNSSNKSFTNDKQVYFKCICTCLSAIKILVRDKQTILPFENDDLLKLIQNLTGLDTTILDNTEDYDESTTPTSATSTSSSAASTYQLASLDYLNLSNQQLNQEIILNALKLLANLLYNSDYARNYYTTHNLADIIALYLKEINLIQLNKSFYQSQICINTFNMRVLFLLTIFNNDLSIRLREQLQIINYLIEIIDQTIKERLNEQQQKTKFNQNISTGSTISSSSSQSSSSSSAASVMCAIESSSSTSYCYLAKCDIEYLIEILKLLYNLTMEKTMTTSTNYDYEAHLMRLVSILRDLFMCKEEQLDTISEQPLSIQQSQVSIDDLHSNIINLLTNMPQICYEELLIPIEGYKAASLSSDNRKKGSSNKQRKRKPTVSKSSLNSNNATSAATAVDSEILDIDDNYEYEGKNMEAINQILKYLRKCLTNYINQKQPVTSTAAAHASKYSSRAGEQLQPVLLLLSIMSKSNRHIRKYCRLKVLPPLRDEVLKLPTDGTRLRNNLAKLMTDSNTQIKILSQQFLFVLCKENVDRLVKYTGFGNSAGLLADLGLLNNSNKNKFDNKTEYSSDSENSDTEEYTKLKEKINPVIGKVDIRGDSSVNLFEGMTDEQIEYVASELMNNISKLIDNGVIRPAKVGDDGKPKEVTHVLELCEDEKGKNNNNNNNNKSASNHDDNDDTN